MYITMGCIPMMRIIHRFKNAKIMEIGSNLGRPGTLSSFDH